MKKLWLSAAFILSLCSCDSPPRRLGLPIPQAHRTNLIDLYSRANNVPPLLVRAVIRHESAGYSRAQREEKSSRYCPNQNRDCRTSWGLGQIMGFHAKSLNLRSPRELLDPETNIYATTKILGRCFHSAKGDTFKTLACYNGDRTGKYAKKVTLTLKEILNDRLRN